MPQGPGSLQVQLSEVQELCYFLVYDSLISCLVLKVIRNLREEVVASVTTATTPVSPEEARGGGGAGLCEQDGQEGGLVSGGQGAEGQ